MLLYVLYEVFIDNSVSRNDLSSLIMYILFLRIFNGQNNSINGLNLHF